MPPETETPAEGTETEPSDGSGDEPSGEDKTQDDTPSEGLLGEAGGDDVPAGDDTTDDPEEGQDDGDTEEPAKYVPTGELTEDQVESLPEHMVTDDGKVDVEELAKQNLGFRDMQSEGTLEEAVEFYQEHQGELDEDTDSEESDNDEPSNVPESPDDYDLTLKNEEGEEVEMDEQVKSIVQEAGHESEMTEQQLNEFVNNFEQMFNNNFTPDVDPDEELGKISDDPQQAQKIVNEVNGRIEGMHERGFLTDQEYKEAIIMGGTAEGVSVLRKFMERADDFEEVPSGQSSVGGESVSDIQSQLDKLMNHDAYFDPSHPEHERVNKEADQLRQKKRKKENNKK